jgi:hypothetical protein
MRNSVKYGLLGSVTIAALAVPCGARADQISDLQAQINALSAKLSHIQAAESRERHAEANRALRDREIADRMKTRQDHDEQLIAARNAHAQKVLQAQTPTRAEQQGLENDQYVKGGVLPGSFLIPGTDTSVHIGGFINFQAAYSPTQNLGPKFAIGNLLPPGAARRATSGDFQFQSKVSRLIVQSSTPSEFGPITTNFALDFYGFVSGGDYNQALQNNSYSARIVYAFGTIGPLTVGMLNSNFIDDPDQGETFDNAGPAGIPAERTEQIRYTYPFSKINVLSVAAEDPQSGYQDTRDNIEEPSVTNPMPDFSLRFEHSGPMLHYQASGVVRDIAYTDGFGQRVSHFTGAGIVGATLQLGAVNKAFGKDNFGGQAWFGGIGRYIPDDFGANVASVLAVDNGTSGTPDVVNSKIQYDQGFTLFAQHFWTKLLRSSVSVGYNHQNMAAFLPSDVNNAPTTKTVHVNLILRPVPSVDLGIEAMMGQKSFQKSTGIGPKNAERVEAGGIWHF